MKKGCKYCKKTDKNDKFETVHLASGPWVSVYIRFDENEKPYIMGSAEEETERFYFNYCPVCGRKINKED